MSRSIELFQLLQAGKRSDTATVEPANNSNPAPRQAEMPATLLTRGLSRQRCRPGSAQDARTTNDRCALAWPQLGAGRYFVVLPKEAKMAAINLTILGLLHKSVLLLGLTMIVEAM